MTKSTKTFHKTLNVDQWKNSTSVIDWFEAINNKPQYTFFVFWYRKFLSTHITTSIWESTQFCKTNNTYWRQRFENYDAFQKESVVPWQGTIYKKRRQWEFQCSYGIFWWGGSVWIGRNLYTKSFKHSVWKWECWSLERWWTWNF